MAGTMIIWHHEWVSSILEVLRCFNSLSLVELSSIVMDVAGIVLGSDTFEAVPTLASSSTEHGI